MYLGIKKLMSRYPSTLWMKKHLCKITKYLANYICSYIICKSKNFLKAGRARIVKIQVKNPQLLIKNFEDP